MRKVEAEKADLDLLAGDRAADREMAEMAREEAVTLVPRLAALEEQLKVQLLPKDAADDRSAILEVRAGAGGDEAALFAADLFRMYSRYAELHGWKVELISASENDLGRLPRSDRRRSRARVSSPASSSSPACTGCSASR